VPHGELTAKKWLDSIDKQKKRIDLKEQRDRQTDRQTESMTNKKLSYCWETVRRESMPRIAEMDVEMTT